MASTLPAVAAPLATSLATTTPVNPNSVLAKRHNRRIEAGHVATSLALGMATGIAIASTVSGAFMLGLMVFMMTFLFGGVAASILRIEEDRTLPLPGHLDAHSVERTVAGLVHASRNGLPVVDRRRLQDDLLEACAVLRAMLGVEPWVAMTMHGNPGPLQERMAQRAEDLREIASALVLHMADARSPKGIEMRSFRNSARRPTLLIAALAADFGLDAGGFAPDDVPVAGQRVLSTPPIPEAALAARRLADEWTSARSSVETPTSVMADGAVREIEAAERLWEHARSVSEPERHPTIDAEMAAIAATASGTISEAIAERSRIAVDDLSTQRRFVEAKHA